MRALRQTFELIGDGIELFRFHGDSRFKGKNYTRGRSFPEALPVLERELKGLQALVIIYLQPISRLDS